MDVPVGSFSSAVRAYYSCFLVYSFSAKSNLRLNNSREYRNSVTRIHTFSTLFCRIDMQMGTWCQRKIRSKITNWFRWRKTTEKLQWSLKESLTPATHKTTRSRCVNWLDSVYNRGRNSWALKNRCVNSPTPYPRLNAILIGLSFRSVSIVNPYQHCSGRGCQYWGKKMFVTRNLLRTQYLASSPSCMFYACFSSVPTNFGENCRSNWAVRGCLSWALIIELIQPVRC